jgi:hypothetical protein
VTVVGKMRVGPLNSIATVCHPQPSPLRGRLAYVSLEGSGERADMREANVGEYLADRFSFEQQALRALDLKLLSKIGEGDPSRLQTPAQDVNADTQSPTDLRASQARFASGGLRIDLTAARKLPPVDSIAFSRIGVRISR